MGKGNIKKKPQPTKGKNLKPLETIEIPHHDYPIFCFKHLHKDFHLENCETDEKKSLIERIVKFSQMTWHDIQQADKHGLGSEKIARNSLKAKCPPFITDDVEFLLALRFDGLKPMVGHRDRFIFHVIFLDRAFELYKH